MAVADVMSPRRRPGKGSGIFSDKGRTATHGSASVYANVPWRAPVGGMCGCALLLAILSCLTAGSVEAAAVTAGTAQSRAPLDGA
jgi:hypothetical protein